MFNVIYRWRIHGDKENQFEVAWAEVTHLFRTHRGALGSRLHRCSDGTYLAYAQWPDQRAWVQAFDRPLPENSALSRMQEMIASSEEPIQMQLLKDLFD